MLDLYSLLRTQIVIMNTVKKVVRSLILDEQKVLGRWSLKHLGQLEFASLAIQAEDNEFDFAYYDHAHRAFS
jgi:hypothetical protein